MKSIQQLQGLQKALKELPLFQNVNEEKYPCAYFSPIQNIIESYQIIIGRLHILDSKIFQTLVEQGMDELYEHLNLLLNAQTIALQKEYYNDFYVYLDCSIQDSLKRCLPESDDFVLVKTDRRIILN
jgi:hypothetical protein